jgi:hypothetical protein
MGPQNQSWSRLLNIKGSRHSKIINETDHPIEGITYYARPLPRNKKYEKRPDRGAYVFFWSKNCKKV